MSRFLLVIALVASIAIAKAQLEHTGICKRNYCNCVNAESPLFTIINCTVPDGVAVDVFNLDLPKTTAEIIIDGSEGVMFGQGAFTGVSDMRRITVRDAKMVVFRAYAGVGMNVVNLFVNVERCDVLRFEKNTFVSMKGPVSGSIKDCDEVFIEGDAFSWILNMDVYNVREMTLGEGAFNLERTASNIGEHGPGMAIDMRNISLPELPRATFGSSAARVYLESVDVHTIRTGAFSANTYNVVMAINCSIHVIEEEAFSENSLINYLSLNGSKIQQLSSRAFRSAIGNITIIKTRFDNVGTGAINTTVAAVVISDNEFHKFSERGFELSSCNTLHMERNSFDTIPPYGITAPGANIHELLFNENEIEFMYPKSLAFIGPAEIINKVEYVRNFYGHPCHCNISDWVAEVFGAPSGQPYEEESYCTVDELIARCFNVPEQNMMFQRFIKEVCHKNVEIKCEKFRAKTNGGMTEIKNPRFPHKTVATSTLSDRDKKVIGIVIVSAASFVLIVLLISLIRCMKRQGYCFSFKNLIMSSSSRCGVLCARICNCGNNLEDENAESISALSIHEYSERQCLNDQDLIQETSFQEVAGALVPTSERFTQTLPEELTKELLDNLKERLDSPENYVEAREMIEHLYELTKINDMPSVCATTTIPIDCDENIYELPFQNTTGRIGKNNKNMVSIGTKVPSLEKLTPLSPYYRQPALAHEYFEPRDVAVHLYAEIANEKEKKSFLGVMPDVIAEQAGPRGPYLRAVLHNNPTPVNSPPPSSHQTAPRMTTIKSTCSNSSGKMLNRPLPKKPTLDPGAGTSTTQG